MSVSIYDEASLDLAYDALEVIKHALQAASTATLRAEELADIYPGFRDTSDEIVAHAADQISQLEAARDVITERIRDFESGGFDNRPGSAVLTYAR